MEMGGKGLGLSDEDQSILHHEPSPTILPAMREVPDREEEEMRPEANIQMKYYLQFKKIYLTSFKLWGEVDKQIRLKNDLTAKVTLLENQLTTLHKQKRPQPQEEQLSEHSENSKKRASKRTRRTAEEIERKFYCQADFCDRCYGSDGSLQQHIKLKHPEIYRSREDSYQL